MKKLVYVGGITAIATGFISCGNSTVTLEETPGEIVLHPENAFLSTPSITVLHNADMSTSLAAYDKERHTVVFFDVFGTELQSIALKLPDSVESKVQTLYGQAISLDSVLLFETGSRTISLFNAKGEMQNSWRAETALADHTSDYCLLAMSQSPVKYDGKNLFSTCTRLDVIVRTPEARIKYFSTPPEITIDMASGEQKNSGIWPAEYKAGVSYRDFYPQRCINGKKEMVYSFAASDSIFVLKDDKLVGKYACKSKYMTERHPYPDDSLGHFFFLEKYTVTEPRYLNLLYDPYRNFYYRIVHHAIPFEKNKLTLNTFSDKPWSIMMLDQNFEPLNEITFDAHRFLPAVFVTREGLLIKKNPGTASPTRISFTLYRFKE